MRLRALTLLMMVSVLVVAMDADARKVKRTKTTPEQPVVKAIDARVSPDHVGVSRKQLGSSGDIVAEASSRRPGKSAPKELAMKKAPGHAFDLRKLPKRPPVKRERPERELPPIVPRPLDLGTVVQTETAIPPYLPQVHAPAPAPIASFAGLDLNTWGGGWPPDTNGDVGPDHYIQTINTSIGIYNKSTGAELAAFTFDTFMSQGNFGNLCDTNNFGDPVVLYDSFEDRWIITDFAFEFDGLNNVANPPGAFECIAVSMTGDPVIGGWNFYSINTTGGLGDYPKLGIWPDGLYMSVNMFDYADNGPFQNARVYAFNKAQMYAGSPTVKVVAMDLTAGPSTVLPSNARLQTGAPPVGAPNYLAMAGSFLNAVEIYKFHVDWDRPSLSTITGPTDTVLPLWWARYFNPTFGQTAPTPLQSIDTLYPRTMVQNQYSNIGGTEALWFGHTVGAGNPTSIVPAATTSGVRYYQVNVTGGTIATNAAQSFTYSPDSTFFRFMPSIAVNRAGDLAIGYSTSNAGTNPSINYAGRLASDPVNTITQTEQLLVAGTGAQNGTSRWGDYSAMTLDPNGCTFWFTTEYYIANGLNYQTRIGSFAYPSCVPVGAGGTVSGTVRRSSDASVIAGATVQLGARTATTNGSGVYSFTAIPAGTYASITASVPGFNASTLTTINVADSGTTTKDFSLSATAIASCPADTTQSDFQTGLATALDLISAPGSITLAKSEVVDQQNSTVTNSGFGFNATFWRGQTFQAAMTGNVSKVDLELFCGSCSGTPPAVTVAIRATAGGLPTGADLGVATIPGFTSGSGGTFTATFGTPVPIVSGTTYAVIFRAAGALSAGTYAFLCSCASPDSNPYSNGAFVSSGNSGGTWAADTNVGGRDLGFAVYIQPGFLTAGDFVSSPKDSNPAGGANPTWSTMTWNASVPANSTLTFQVAGADSVNGPFNFVGPDGTAASFFTTSPATLTQFNGYRFLEYRAFFTSTNLAASATLNDVTLCYSDVTGPPAPTAVVAAGNGAVPNVTLTWLPSIGATSYNVYRRDAAAGFHLVGNTALLTFTDTTAGMAANSAYLYRIRAVSGAAVESPNSASDLATTFVFAEAIVLNTTKVKAAHFNELRSAVNAVRAVAGLSAFSFVNSVAGNSGVKTSQIAQLRTNLNSALSLLLLPSAAFADPALPANTKISVAHITQLRVALQ